jgi:hypothetical protein
MTATKTTLRSMDSPTISIASTDVIIQRMIVLGEAYAGNGRRDIATLFSLKGEGVNSGMVLNMLLTESLPICASILTMMLLSIYVAVYTVRFDENCRGLHLQTISTISHRRPIVAPQVNTNTANTCSERTSTTFSQRNSQ